MPRFCTLALAAALITTTACGDDDSAGPTAEDIVGTWDILENNAETNVVSSFGDQTFTSKATLTSESSTAEITFDADGTYTTAGEITLVTVTESLLTGSIEQRDRLDYSGQSGTWELSGNTIVFTGASLNPTGGDFATQAGIELPEPGAPEITTFVPGERMVLEIRIDDAQIVPGSGTVDLDVVSTVTLVR